MGRRVWLLLVVMVPAAAWAESDFWEEMTNPGISEYRQLVDQAMAAVASGTYEEALARLQGAAELLPQEPAALAWRGYVLSKLGRFDEAAAQWHGARERGGRLLEEEGLAFEYALTLARLGRSEAAAELFSSMLERGVSPERRPAVLVNLADMLALARCPDLDDAAELFREAVRAYPDFPAAHWGLAGVLARTGQYDELWAELGAAMRLDPQWQSFLSPTLYLVPAQVIHLYRALGWHYLGHADEARRELRAHLEAAGADRCRVETLPGPGRPGLPPDQR